MLLSEGLRPVVEVAEAVVVALLCSSEKRRYSVQVFSDASLNARAAAAHRRCHLTLLTALDLPWRADGLQRDGAERRPADGQ